METIILTSTYYKPHYGGVENSIFFLAREYQKQGKNVIILTSDAPLSKKGRLNPFEEREGIKVIRYRRYIPKIYFDYYFKPSIDVKIIRKVLKDLKSRHNIIHVISRSPETAKAAAVSGLTISYLLPGIAKNQDHTIPKGILDFKTHFLNQIVLAPMVRVQREALLKVQGVFAFSDNMREQIVRFLGKKKLIKIVSPGVDYHQFKPVKSNKKSNSFTFLIVGRLIKDKAIHLALESLALLKNKNTNLIIVGDGPEKAYLESLSVKLRIQERVDFQGKIVTDIEKKYAESDCYLMTSVRETFGQTIIEAMSAGLPVIAWKKSENVLTASSEILKHGENGYLVDFDIRIMAKFMDQISKSSTRELDQMKTNNTSLIKKKYTWEKLSQDLMQV